MQQILLSSQNLSPNLAKAANGSAESQSASTPFSASNQAAVLSSHTSVNAIDVTNTHENQGVERSFMDVLNDLKLPQDTEVTQRLGLDDWDKILNENPALKEQLSNNPELSEQILSFIEGQELSSEGEMLPPLLADEGESLLVESKVNNLDANTSEALSTLQQMVANFLSEKDAATTDQSSNPAQTAQGHSTHVLGSGVANISVPYTLSTQPDSINTKAWGRFFEGSQSTVLASNTGGSAVTSADVNTTDIQISQTRVGNSFNFHQGQGADVAILQSETDVQFKASFDSFKALDAEPGDLLESGRSLDRLDASKSQFSEIQSKLQGAGLKQYSMSLETNVQDPDWGEQMGQKIVWLTGRAIQSAEIHLNPADLGPIEVQIKVQNEQAAVTFHAQNNTVRDMLESNVHRLREMMESNGVDLTEVSVGSEDSGAQYSAKDGGENEADRGESSDGKHDLSADASDEQVLSSNVSNRIVDFYA